MDYKWETYYNSAKDYYLNCGNLLVPYRYKTSNGICLGTWISRMRGKYKCNNLHYNKIIRLESIGMVWDLEEYRWNMYYSLCEHYFNTNGSLEVPLRYKIDGISLGRWVHDLRHLYGTDLLSREKVDMLNSIGMNWSIKNVSSPKNVDAQINVDKESSDFWVKNYLLAKKYYEINGDLLIPTRYVTSAGVRLGKWINNMRCLYNKNALTDNSISLLESINMIWDFRKYDFDRKFYLAKSYYEDNGDLSVPSNYITSCGFRLGKWISRKRGLYRKNHLEPYERDKLRSIGMT